MYFILMLVKFIIFVFFLCLFRKLFFILRRNFLQGLGMVIMVVVFFLKNLEDGVLCYICFDYLRDFVIIDCGFVFCYYCIIKVCEFVRQLLYCFFRKIVFKRENMYYVWQMVSLVENIWRMKVDEERYSREESLFE